VTVIILVVVLMSTLPVQLILYSQLGV